MKGASFGLCTLALVLVGCGGGGGTPTDAGSTANPQIKGGGFPLTNSMRPTADMTIAQTISLPVGTTVGVSLDRNNGLPAYYPAVVKGFDALDNVLWIELTSEVTTPGGEGDSGSATYTLPTSFAAGSPLNQKLIGSLSFGSTDNQRDFLITPISVERTTGGGAAAAVARPTQINFKGHTFKRLATPVFYRGVPDIVFAKMKSRAGANSIIRNMVPMPTTGTTALFESPKILTLDPYQHSTIITLAARGDIVFSGATGSVTTTDGNGWLGYGHPLNGGGPVTLATCPGTVVDMYYAPVNGTYKLANPGGAYSLSMTYDGINGVRIAPTTASEVALTSQLVSSSNKVLKTASHRIGYDGVVGDQSGFLVSAIESSYLAFYDREVDLLGSATFKVTTVINKVSSTSEITVPAAAGGIFFGTDPSNPLAVTLDLQLYELMYAVESSGDRTATVTVSAQVNLSP